MKEETESSDIEYSVSMFDENNQPFKLIFDSKETKESFILSERKYCKEEEISHFKSIDKSDRLKTSSDLNSKRVKHAVAKGYKPVGHEKSRWFFIPTVKEDILA